MHFRRNRGEINRAGSEIEGQGRRPFSPAGRRAGLAAVTIFAVLATAATATADPGLGQRIDSDSARGESAMASVAASADQPREIVARVTASPRQRVVLSYTVTCATDGHGPSIRGSVSGRAPLEETLPLPKSNPSRCSVGAQVQLDDGGRVKVELYAK